ncbi:MAG: L,D-transpeptidase [Leptolyngbyaceae cyanobacterium]
MRSLIIGLPLLGGLWVFSGAAYATDQDQAVAPSLVPDSVSLPTKLPVSNEKWPLPSTQEQPVELVVQIAERQLYVYRGDVLETTFPVAVGKTGWETPTGTFEVSYMLENPGWTNPFTDELMPPGPENPLGERWIAFWTDGHNEIGFHGTSNRNRNSIGHAESHGCIRLYNEHIRELYDIVTPGTLVTVLP